MREQDVNPLGGCKIVVAMLVVIVALALLILLVRGVI